MLNQQVLQTQDDKLNQVFEEQEPMTTDEFLEQSSTTATPEKHEI